MSKVRTPEPIGFTRFWDEYGYKVGKKACLKLWEREGLERLTSQICQSIPAYDAHLAANPWKHKKHPHTFLNGAHWEDEYPEAGRPKNTLTAAQSIYERLERESGYPREETVAESHSGHAQQLSSTNWH